MSYNYCIHIFISRSVSLDSIIDHLSKKNMLIALVDWNHLKCQWCDTKVTLIFVLKKNKCMSTVPGTDFHIAQIIALSPDSLHTFLEKKIKKK